MKPRIIKRTLSLITVLALIFTLAVQEPARFSQPMSTNTPMYMSTAFSAGAQTRNRRHTPLLGLLLPAR